MKWEYAINGNTRVITKFAILPIRLKGEVRWLEKVKIKQVYNDYYIKRWRNDYFID